VEEAPLGLAYVMRKHDAVFYRERGDAYIIDVPKRTRSGKPDHREYEEWTITRDKVDLMTKDLECGVPPMRLDAQPQAPGRRRRSLKGRGGKRIS